MNYRLLKEVIEYLEEFDRKESPGRIEDFVIWVSSKVFLPEGQKVHPPHDELLIPFKLMHLNKALKKQTKHILSNSQVSSIDEYSFLLHLNHQESFRKMEIVDMHNLEAPTGIEIIKRLLKKKLVEEFPDEEDKRAKRIKITREGIGELESIQPNIEAVFGNFISALNLKEKIILSGLLDKLVQ
jgi:DNA-binding MarR family transcriptional regulator